MTIKKDSETKKSSGQKSLAIIIIILFVAAFLILHLVAPTEKTNRELMTIPNETGYTNIYYENMPDILRVNGSGMGYENLFVEPSQEGTEISLLLTNRNIPNPNMGKLDMIIFKKVSIEVKAESRLTGELSNHSIMIFNETFGIHSQGGIEIVGDIRKDLLANGYKAENYRIVKININ